MGSYQLDRPAWALDPEQVVTHCSRFITDRLKAAGRDRLVVGLSGGIDSSVAAGLAVAAIGADQVLGVQMPYATSSQASLDDAKAVADHLGVATERIEITSMADAFLAQLADGDAPVDRIRAGNVMARCRMIVLYDRSARDGSLVLGTGNRTEALLGYTTLYGDNACALNPVGQLYKTEIRLLADHLGLPDVVLTKAPSADLWEGQADEDELGFTYAEVDSLLHQLVDQRLGRKQLTSLGFDNDLIDRVQKRMRAMAFKRQLPPVAPFPGRLDPDQGSLDAAPSAVPDGGFH